MSWLKEQPREWSVVIAMRAALRVLPMIASSRRFMDIVLPVLRAAAISRFAAKYPNRNVARAAGDAALAASEATAIISANDSSAFYAYAVSDAAAVVAYESTFYNYAADAASIYTTSPATDAVTHDAKRLFASRATTEELSREFLWPFSTPADNRELWERFSQELRRLGTHWEVWIDWYETLAMQEPYGSATEAEDAAFTDVPGKLPWPDGALAVNTEIVRRLKGVRRGLIERSSTEEANFVAAEKRARTLDRLAEMASPQPSITEKGQLDAGPNQPFDIPTVDDDLSTLPLRQRNLVKGVLRDLPSNAPKHLKDFLRSYGEELKSRGTQPIIGLLKDDADIIAAAVAAPRAEDEWLDPGMRKAFERFAENHELFVKHFPLDVEREAIYAATPVDEVNATGKKFTEPFEKVAEATRDAHRAGTATDDFMMVIDKMTEFARVVATTPPAQSSDKRQSASSPEITVSPEDRMQLVTTKKRVILGSLGFFERTYAVIGTTVTVTGYSGLVEALKPAIEMLMRLLH